MTTIETATERDWLVERLMRSSAGLFDIFTTYLGHLNVWGLDRLVDFRCRTPADVRTVIEDARSHGWPTSVNHPEIPGMATSMPTTSGWWLRASRMASRPSLASPTTWMCDCASSMCFSPERTTAWSSASRTRTGAASGGMVGEW